MLPDPAPELLHRIEVGRLGRHMPELHFAIAMGLAALCCSEEALVVAQDMPWAPLGDWLQRFDGISSFKMTDEMMFMTKIYKYD